MFAAHGIPEQVKSDNGPPFQGAVFREYSMEKGFKHRRVTPLWPEANGLAENFMRNIGKVARTAHSEGNDWRRELYTFVAQYRATKHPSTGVSPNALMYSRELRGKLPEITKTTIPPQVAERDSHCKTKSKLYADEKRHVQHHTLKPGDLVIARQPKANTLTPPYDPVPYCVQGVNGTMITAEKLSNNKRLTRNSSHFKRVTPASINLETPVEDLETEDDEEEETTPVEQGTEQAATAPTTPRRATRSGREVRTPAWMSDYVSK